VVEIDLQIDASRHGIEKHAETLCGDDFRHICHCLWASNVTYDFARQNLPFSRRNSLRFNELNAEIAQESFFDSWGSYWTRFDAKNATGAIWCAP
jgi:hypothetical protein